MFRYLTFLFAAVCCAACAGPAGESPNFIRTDGMNLVDAHGERFEIRGTNLGHWLNPEGYLFGFPKSADSPRRIHEGLCQIAGPAYMEHFWRTFRENYITREDIAYIASTGATTVRLPLHYKLFTDEEYLGLHAPGEGFALVDKVVAWCREAGLRLILDMHDCPGGQTGDNIDDSYGYPWLFRSPELQERFIAVWRSIAARYADEPAILGYDLMNEPIAHYFEDREELNAALQPLMIRTAKAIREADPRHVLILGGAQWNTNFKVYDDWTFDDNLVFSCHIYKCPPSVNSLRGFAAFRDRSQCPMYMGETGENTDEWVAAFRRALDETGIGWTFWTYKRLDTERSFVSVAMPEGWERIVDFLAADRSSYALIREAHPDRDEVHRILDAYLENCRFANCRQNNGYVAALGLKP
ncbi:MAG: glycoside hydrolase family 5 protein [Alistipes sp.]|nr:glycoside hydrolase family 5 protein [Alistipes senegalensis]MCM1250676.1 glycoside hydrolase family 5 protein [Alistipes sp.]